MTGKVGIKVGILIATIVLIVAYTDFLELGLFQNCNLSSRIPHEASTAPVFSKTNTRKKMKPGYLRMVRAKTTTVTGENQCIIVACYDDGAFGVEYFREYYKSFGYTMRLLKFKIMRSSGGQKAAPAWCRIPAVIDTINRYPQSRVLYLDLDTIVNPTKWCNLPDNNEHAPIVMNSLQRSKIESKSEFFYVHGTQVQTNAFIVTAGEHGRKAMERWESFYNPKMPMVDQGVIHYRENRLCGLPGLIQCYSNPDQQKCHCGGIRGKKKEPCIKDLFEGKKKGCVFNITQTS